MISTRNNNSGKNVKKCIEIILRIPIELGIFICTCILCSLSSSNPLESHIIGNITNYFNTIPNNTFFFSTKRFCCSKICRKK